MLITTSSETAYRNITERGEPAGRPAARESRVQRTRRAAVNGATARKRQREEEEADGGRPYREATQLTQNKNQLRILDCAAPGLVRLRAPGGAQDMTLQQPRPRHARPESPRRHGGGQTQGARPVGPLKRLGPGGLTMSYPQPGAPKGPHPIVRA